MFYHPLKQWAIMYDAAATKPAVIGGNYFSIWVDDATGKFVRYGYDR